MKKKKAYLLGDMLKKGSQWVRNWEKEQLSTVETIELFVPQDQKDINDKSTNPSAEMIFAKDTNAILNSEIIIADVDNLYTGSVTEVGQIWGINHMLDRLDSILLASKSDREVVEGIHALMNEIPKKRLYWQHTDIRHTDIPEAGMRRSHSLNQYLYGCLLDVSGDVMEFDEILGELKKLPKEEAY